MTQEQPSDLKYVGTPHYWFARAVANKVAADALINAGLRGLAGEFLHEGIYSIAQGLRALAEKGMSMGIKLSELNGTFLRIEFVRGDRGAAEKADGIPASTLWQFENSLAKADGVQFLCPKCFVANGRSAAGTHSIICWFRGGQAPADLSPGPGRWTPAGTGLDDLTFVPGDPPQNISVQLNSGCSWHGFVEKGEVRDAEAA